MQELALRPFELRYGPRLSNAEQKFRSLLALRPPYFLAVAPDVSRAFEVDYPVDWSLATLKLTPLKRIPSAPA
jgi:hypothetical protein